MALTRFTGVRGLKDCKIIPIISDTATGVVYGDMIDIPGVTGIQRTPEYTEDQLEGDDEILDIYRKVRSIGWTLNFSKSSLDALGVLLGGDVSESTGQILHRLTADDFPKYFKLIARSDYSTDYPDGDHHVVLYKCKGGLDDNYGNNAYASFTASGQAIKQVANSRIMDTLYHSAESLITSPGGQTHIERVTTSAIATGTASEVVVAAVKITNGTAGTTFPGVSVDWAVAESTTAGVTCSLWKESTVADADGLAYNYVTAATAASTHNLTATSKRYNTATSTWVNLTGSPMTFVVTVT